MRAGMMLMFGLPLALGCGEKNQSSDADGTVYATDCAALQTLFVTDAVDSVDDWTGYWLCFQEENSCSGSETIDHVRDDAPARERVTIRVRRRVRRPRQR